MFFENVKTRGVRNIKTAFFGNGRGVSARPVADLAVGRAEKTKKQNLRTNYFFQYLCVIIVIYCIQRKSYFFEEKKN